MFVNRLLRYNEPKGYSLPLLIGDGAAQTHLVAGRSRRRTSGKEIGLQCNQRYGYFRLKICLSHNLFPFYLNCYTFNLYILLNHHTVCVVLNTVADDNELTVTEYLCTLYIALYILNTGSGIEDERHAARSLVRTAEYHICLVRVEVSATVLIETYHAVSATEYVAVSRSSDSDIGTLEAVDCIYRNSLCIARGEGERRNARFEDNGIVCRDGLTCVCDLREQEVRTVAGSYVCLYACGQCVLVRAVKERAVINACMIRIYVRGDVYMLVIANPSGTAVRSITT